MADERKPQWVWSRTRRGIAVCPRCFALVPPNRRADHEYWHRGGGGVRIGSLCSGYGGLELGVQAVYGGATAWVSDIDKGACKILAHRFPGVPNIGDMTTVDWADVEPVDVLCAGFPCQPVSQAGDRLGSEDERWLWDEVAYAVSCLQPGLVVLENVRGLLTAGSGDLFGQVLGRLADLGYDANWHGLRASEVGAPHRRFRVFITATHPRGFRRPGDDSPRAGQWDAPGSDRPVGPIEWGGYGSRVAAWERQLGRPAPRPWDQGATGSARLSPLFAEWMMGLPAGWVTDVPGITRNEALKALGNGVVPQQCAEALRVMASWEVAA